MNKLIKLKVPRKTLKAITLETVETISCAMPKKTMEVNLPSEHHHDGVDERTYCQTPSFSLDEPSQFARYSHRVDVPGG